MTLGAQQYDALEQVRRDIRKCYGMEGPHRFDGTKDLTKAPNGYKPFYINHYGRHGSRYAWNPKTYSILHDVLSGAHEAGCLTPYGEDFRERYEAFYVEPLMNTGDLTALGYEQHVRIGEYVGRSFPQVFRKGRKVDAISSTAQRCIVSMGAFNIGLAGECDGLEYRLCSNHKGMSIVAPPSAPKSMVRHFEGEKAEVNMESVFSFWARSIDPECIVSKIFTDKSYVDSIEGGPWSFVCELWQLYCGYHNYESEPLFDDLLTDDQRVGFWEAFNYSSFRGDVTARYTEIPLLEDFILKAENAFDDPDVAANLRFGHDYILEAFLCLLNVNGCGTIPATAEDVKYWFQNYNIPMAATLMFVYYTDRKGDILFKVLLNEEEAVLPQFEPVSGPYYRWDDFVKWAEDVKAAHPEIVS